MSHDRENAIQRHPGIVQGTGVICVNNPVNHHASKAEEYIMIFNIAVLSPIGLLVLFFLAFFIQVVHAFLPELI